jgi:hypothetical protein
MLPWRGGISTVRTIPWQGGDWGPVAPAVFKTVVPLYGGGWVRLPFTSAIFVFRVRACSDLIEAGYDTGTYFHA